MARKIRGDKEAEAEADADDIEEESNSEIKNKTPLLRSTKRRSLSTTREKFQTWPLQTETSCESDSGSCTPSKSQHISIPRPTPARSTGLEGDTSDDGAKGPVGGRSHWHPSSHMTVV